MALGCDMEKSKLWAKFCWENLDYDVKLTHTALLNIVADQVHPFLGTQFPCGNDLCQQDKALLRLCITSTEPLKRVILRK